MKPEDRKAAIAAYKKRSAAAGIFAVRCQGSGEGSGEGSGQGSGEGSGQVWVGQTLNLDTMQNRIWFSLRMGNHSNADLQRAWSTHGEANFAYEALEQLEDEALAYVRDKLLKERELHWRATLGGLNF